MGNFISSIIGLFNPVDDAYSFVKTAAFLLIGGAIAIISGWASYGVGYQLGYAKAKLFGQEAAVRPIEPDNSPAPISPDTGQPSPFGEAPNE